MFTAHSFEQKRFVEKPCYKEQFPCDWWSWAISRLENTTMGVILLNIGRCCYNGFESQSLTTNFPFPSYCKTRVAVAKQLEQSRTNASWTKKSWKESFSVDGVMTLILNLCSSTSQELIWNANADQTKPILRQFFLLHHHSMNPRSSSPLTA